MKTKTLEDILFQVYELGVQQTDCDLTKKANTIMMLANKRVIEELEKLPKQDVPLGATITISYLDVLTRIKQLKQ